jgi:DNA-directed RNA polymerase specialized sigma24 family protein
MSEPRDITHPLLVDLERFERIKRAMFLRIQTLIKRKSTVRRSTNGGMEMVLPGGESADGILHDAVLKLLRAKVPLVPETNWEALGMKAAYWKSIEALRKSGKGRELGRREDGTVELIPVVSLDKETVGPEGDLRTFMELADAEHGKAAWQAEIEEYESMLRMHRILQHIRRVLDTREQIVFFAVVFDHKTYKEIELQPPVTSVRVGQIFHRAREKIAAAIEADPELAGIIERSVR